MTGPKLHYASQFIIAAMDEWGGPVTPTTGTPVYLKQDYDALQAKVRELEERLTTLKQQRIKYGPICLVCGAAEPCRLKDDPHSPCTFDPAPRELWDRCQEQKQRVSELEEQIRVATAINHAFKQSEENLEAKLRKAEEERTCADEIHQRICEILDSEQWREGNRVLASWEVVQRIMQERDQLRARAGELEEALRTVSSVGRNILKPKFDHCGFMNATQLGNRDAVLHMLKQVERALEGKEEHGSESRGPTKEVTG